VSSAQSIRSAALGAGLTMLLACGSGAERQASMGGSIRLEPIATLGTEEGPGALRGGPMAAMGEVRRYIVTLPDVSGEPPFVFDSAGNFVRRLGTVGEGPGEFVQPGAVVVDDHDSVHIFDKKLGRVTVFDPALREIRAVTGVPSRYDAIRLGDGDYVVNGDPEGRRPFTRYAPDGRRLTSFGDTTGSTTRLSAAWLDRVMTPDGHGGFWSAPRRFRLELTHWSSSGERLGKLQPRAEWFEPYDSLREITPYSAPSAEVTGLWVDGNGHVWILGRTSDPHWARGLGSPVKTEGGRETYPVADYRGVFDAVLQVVDLTSGEMLATQIAPDSIWTLEIVAPGTVASPRRSDLGWWRLGIYRVTLDAAASAPPDGA